MKTLNPSDSLAKIILFLVQIRPLVLILKVGAKSNLHLKIGLYFAYNPYFYHLRVHTDLSALDKRVTNDINVEHTCGVKRNLVMFKIKLTVVRFYTR